MQVLRLIHETVMMEGRPLKLVIRPMNGTAMMKKIKSLPLTSANEYIIKCPHLSVHIWTCILYMPAIHFMNGTTII